VSPEVASLLFSSLARGLWKAAFYSLVVLWAMYAWVRLPHWLGALVGGLIKWLPQHGYPIGIETVSIAPCLSFSPTLALHLNVHATNFYMGNPPKLRCRAPNLVTIADATIIAWIDLSGFVNKLLFGTAPPELFIVHFKTVAVKGLVYNMMYGKTGELNVPALGKQQSEFELKEFLGGAIVWPYVELYRTLTLPNVLRLNIFAVRGLQDLPGLQPRCEVTLRSSVLSTPRGKRGRGADGSTEFTFGSEMLIPVREDCRDGLLIVRVYNDNVGFGRSPALIGIWFMTVKYLLLFPDYCKHKAVQTHGDGAISGTFLLTDAKLRGSAMRSLGPHELGRGLSGELDMALHLTHSELMPPLPPITPKPALDQLSANEVEDQCKFGNWAELREFLSSGPVRFDVEEFTIRDATIEMSDLFSHVKHGKLADEKEDAVVHIDLVDFKPFECVTLLGLIEAIKEQLVSNVLLNHKALLTATCEVFSGLGQSMSHHMQNLSSVASKTTSAATTAASTAVVSSVAATKTAASTAVVSSVAVTKKVAKLTGNAASTLLGTTSTSAK